MHLANVRLVLSSAGARPRRNPRCLLRRCQPSQNTGGEATTGAAPTIPVDAREVHLADLRQLTFGGENAEAYWSLRRHRADLPVHAPAVPACDQIFRMPADGRRVRPWSRPARDARPAPTSSPATSGSSTPRRTSGRRRLPAGARPLARATSGRSTTATTSSAPRPTAPSLKRAHHDAGLRRRGDGLPAGRLDRLHLGARRRPRALPHGRRRRERRAPDQHARLRRRRVLLAGLHDRSSGAPRAPTGKRARGLPAACSAQEPRAPEQARAVGRRRRRRRTPGRSPTSARRRSRPFFPDGKRIIFSSNYGDPKGREFDIWAVNIDGTRPRAHHLRARLRRLPDVLARRQDAGLRVEPQPAASPARTTPTSTWRAGSTRRSRPTATPRRIASSPTSPGSPTTRARAAASAPRASTRRPPSSSARFGELGLEPAGEDGQGGRRSARLRGHRRVKVSRRRRSVVVDGKPLAARRVRGRVSFSARPASSGDVVVAGYGIVATELARDDYKGKDVKGKIVVVRRFVPRRRPLRRRRGAAPLRRSALQGLDRPRARRRAPCSSSTRPS